MSEIFATAKQGVYPKGDTFRGILELPRGAVVLELMVFGKLKKGNGSAGAVFSEADLFCYTPFTGGGLLYRRIRCDA